MAAAPRRSRSGAVRRLRQGSPAPARADGEEDAGLLLPDVLPAAASGRLRAVRDRRPPAALRDSGGGAGPLLGGVPVAGDDDRVRGVRGPGAAVAVACAAGGADVLLAGVPPGLAAGDGERGRGMTGEYAAFLAGKRRTVPDAGLEVAATDLHPALHPFQRDLVRWSLRKGRAALWADTGLGKTLMQLSWATHAADRALILAPLAVARQTVAEGARWGVSVTYAREQSQAADPGITVTNYEMFRHFDPAAFGAIVLDESSILKSHEGKTRQFLIDACRRVPFRLCCTATPAPNDVAELANHAEFLGVLTRAEMLATYFVHDGAGWRLKGHARDPFHRWLASWGMSVGRPSDLGYDDAGYDLPPLTIDPVFLPVDYAPAGQLFFTALKGVGDRAAVRRATLVARIGAAADLINADPNEPWLGWVGLNDEGRELARLVPDAVLVEGNQTPDAKADALTRFAAGEVRVLITKPSVAGFGMNFQRCARMVFVGLSDSYEQYYQAIRRCWRYGQARPVTAHVVLTEPEQAIFDNVLRKERDAVATRRALVRHVAGYEREELGHVIQAVPYEPARPMRLPAWMDEGDAA